MTYIAIGLVPALGIPGNGTALGALVFGVLVATAVVLVVAGRGQTPPDPPRTDGYRAFLTARDGRPDLLRHTLSRREAFFDRLARERPVARYRPDRDTFARNLARRRPEPGLDERMLWLLATAKANQAERFGVGLAELYGKVDPRDPVRLHIALQEHYHTRILADVVETFGLQVLPRPPRLVARALVRVLVV